MKHLTEDILIQYAFDLLEAEAKADAAGHLAECGECAGRLEQIRVQFSALDVLEAEEVLSDELTARTLGQIAAGKNEPRMDTDGHEGDKAGETAVRGPQRSIYIRWIASAAAVLVVGIIIWSPSLKKARQAGQSPVPMQEHLAIVAESESGETYEYAAVRSDKTKEPVVAVRQPMDVSMGEKVADVQEDSLGVDDGDVVVAMNGAVTETTIDGVVADRLKHEWVDKGTGTDAALGVDQDYTVAAKPEGGLLKDSRSALPATAALKDSESKTSVSSAAVGRGAERYYKAEPLAKAAGSLGTSVHNLRFVSADAIPDVAPFAPASAIELVVLPKPDKTQVTIYNSADLTLVQDTRKLTLKPGWNWLQFMWDNTLIDPTSLSLRPLAHDKYIDIELISYPARLKDIGRWLIRSEVEGAVPFEITYFASGLNWRAFYMGTMNEDETAMNLKGYVNVSNHSGQDFVNTQTRLIVGETRLMEQIRTLAQRQRPYGPEFRTRGAAIEGLRTDWAFDTNDDGRVQVDFAFGERFAGYADSGVVKKLGELEIKEIEKKGLSEYFLYTIEGTEDLTNQWSRRLPSFDVAEIPVKSLYKYDEMRYGKEAVRFVSFTNDDEHELGKTPIPEGAIKIYRNLNEVQNLSYVGESSLKYIPVNEDVELNLGPARLVKVEPVLMETQTENYLFDKKGNIDGWDEIEHYRVTVTNTREIAIDLEFTWNMGTEYWELKLTDAGGAVEYKKHDARRGRLTLTVGPRSEYVFEGQTRKYRGRRGEMYLKKQKEPRMDTN